ncbi:MAG: helix-turn-helix protein [Herbinix sp.]|jgi:transcriptional regulator with XRE-family HTH domain|nr:helix-turn-helix protein [Herbinix sp.]
MTGKEFRRWRRNEDITQDKVADMCGIDKSTVSRWENELIVISDKHYNNIMNFIDYMTNKNNMKGRVF